LRCCKVSLELWGWPFRVRGGAGKLGSRAPLIHPPHTTHGQHHKRAPPGAPSVKASSRVDMFMGVNIFVLFIGERGDRIDVKRSTLCVFVKHFIHTKMRICFEFVEHRRHCVITPAVLLFSHNCSVKKQ
jgi:hypothetical protein